MCAKFHENDFIEYFLNCPFCQTKFEFEIFEQHLAKIHKIENLENYGFELKKVKGENYYFDFTINKVRNHNTRGFDIVKGLNNYIANLPSEQFLNLFEEDNKKNIESETSFFITWDNVLFRDQSVLLVNLPLKLKNNTIKFPGSIENLNKIKDSFFKKNFDRKFEFYINGNIIDLKHSEGYSEMIQILDTTKPNLNLHNILLDCKDSKLIDTKHLNNKEILNLKYFKQYDNVYFKFLASLHNPAEKLIPIIENNNGKEEYSMIFQIKINKKKHLIIWENLNPNRATYLFRKESETISKLKDYVTNPNINNKRLRLFRNHDQIIKQELNFYKMLNHTDINSYKKKIIAIVQ